MINKYKNRIAVMLTIVIVITLGCFDNAFAHFQCLLPSDDMITHADERNIALSLMFFHPFEGDYMNMEKPARFGVVAGGRQNDLLATLKQRKVKGFSVWQTNYRITRPGDHVFYVEPKAYWEPAEDKFIVHYTKVVVNAFDLQDSWDTEVGMKTEIIPLTRPYGLYTGNIFQGIVKVNGKPAAFTEVEVEYYNERGKFEAPAPPFTTQVIKTDSQGVFSYVMPKSGWWGFAALSEDEKKIEHNGKEYPVEIGALLWVRVYDMKMRKK